MGCGDYNCPGRSKRAGKTQPCPTFRSSPRSSATSATLTSLLVLAMQASSARSRRSTSSCVGQAKPRNGEMAMSEASCTEAGMGA